MAHGPLVLISQPLHNIVATSYNDTAILMSTESIYALYPMAVKTNSGAYVKWESIA